MQLLSVKLQMLAYLLYMRLGSYKSIIFCEIIVKFLKKISRICNLQQKIIVNITLVYTCQHQKSIIF